VHAGVGDLADGVEPGNVELVKCSV
jgi:hypothetical protein